MPIYEYECGCGNIMEEFSKISNRASIMVCNSCGSTATRIISTPSVVGEDATWINQDLRNSLQPDGEKPIETRSQYRAYLKKHNIVERGTGSRQI